MRNSEKFFLKNNKIPLLFTSGILLFAVAFIVSIASGSADISLKELFGEAFLSTANGRILFHVRLPRTLACLVTGGALAVSGGVIQNVLDNKLASPGIIGVNAGAGLGVTLITALGISGGWQTSVTAFLGAFITVSLVSLIARKYNFSRGSVILAGVALNSILNAFSDSLRTFFPEAAVMSNDFRIGDFSAVTYERLTPAIIIILITTLILLTLSNELDVLTLGEENARGLGMNTRAVRSAFMTCAALLAGCAVSIAGLLTFAGLIIPHTVRRFSGNKALQLIPLCFIFGGAFVCLCDTAARTLFLPYEIPVGIIMAFIGAPFFLFVLIRKKGGHRQ